MRLRYLSDVIRVDHEAFTRGSDECRHFYLVAVKFHPMRDNILIRRRLTEEATMSGSAAALFRLIK